MNTILQNLIFPRFNFQNEEKLYFRRKNDFSYFDYLQNSLILRNSGRISFDTFFGSFSLKKWKEETEIRNLFFKIRGEGEFVIKIIIQTSAMQKKYVSYKKINSYKTTTESIEIENWRNYNNGLIFVEIEAYKDSKIIEGFFYTDEKPKKEINLGIVITHFNRKDYVLPALKRLKAELLSENEFKEKIELFVIDNSKNLPLISTKGLNIIKNKNYGGSGGFARGLLEIINSKRFTHCLFMDDDASCEIESIKRTYKLLRYSNSQKIAISGSLLREEEPYRLLEKGALFNGFVQPMHHWKDMREVNDLINNEIDLTTPNYGAWWFFCFKLKDLNYYPFPFFVRGDDSRFSIVNKFRIITMNGIGVWGEDFSKKTSPLNSYLDMRYHLFHQIDLCNKNRFFLIKYILKFTLIQLASYNYSSVEAALEAAMDFTKGIIIFKDFNYIKLVLKKIASIGNLEKLTSLDNILRNKIVDKSVLFNECKEKESLIKNFLRKITLNGTILPWIFIKKNLIMQEKQFSADLRFTFGYRRIFYVYLNSNEGFITEYNLEKNFRLLKKLIFTLFILFIKFPILKKEYSEEAPLISSKDFWQKAYLLDEN